MKAQKTLTNKITDDVEDKYREIKKYKPEEDIYMIAFYCEKHGLFFWRNIKDNHGICSLCLERDNIHFIKEFHTLQKNITNEKWEQIS
jgi:hypothetical protein